MTTIPPPTTIPPTTIQPPQENILCAIIRALGQALPSLLGGLANGLLRLLGCAPLPPGDGGEGSGAHNRQTGMRNKTLLSLAVAGILLSACGDDGGEVGTGSPGSTSTSTRAPVATTSVPATTTPTTSPGRR